MSEHEHRVDIYLDGQLRTSATRDLNGRQIRQLGPHERVDGFETQEVDNQGRKKRTIGDNETIQVHEHQRFRTVPSEGGPGGSS